MTKPNAVKVAKNAKDTYGEICIIVMFGKKNYRVVTEEAYYYDQERKHNQMYGTPESQRSWKREEGSIS